MVKFDLEAPSATAFTSMYGLLDSHWHSGSPEWRSIALFTYTHAALYPPIGGTEKHPSELNV
jgi:hypothetical protein